MSFKLTIYGGLLTGMVTVLAFYLMYSFNPEGMLSVGFYWSSLILYFFGIALVLLRIKSRQKGLLPFKQALREGFVVFLVANLLFFLFYFWLFNQDPGLLDLQLEQLKSYAETLEPGTPGLEEMRKMTTEDLKVGLGGTIFRYFRGAMGGFLIAGLMAFILKQE